MLTFKVERRINTCIDIHVWRHNSNNKGIFVFHLETILKIHLTTDMKSDSSKETNLKFAPVYRNKINKKSTQFSPLSLFLTSYRLTTHPPFYVKNRILCVWAWRFLRATEHPWQGAHTWAYFRNSVKDFLKELRKVYLSLRSVPSWFWSWLRQLDWIETSIRVFRECLHVLKPTASSKNWTRHHEDPGLFHDGEFSMSLKISWNNSGIKYHFFVYALNMLLIYLFASMKLEMGHKKLLGSSFKIILPPWYFT
jgi:hypothetical protein